MIYQLSSQVVTIHLTLTSTGCKPAETKTLLLPIKINVDNVGAIWISNNSGVSERTKHIDTRAHFVRSFVMDEVVTIDFVKSAENTSDIMTKNQQSVHFKSAQPQMVYSVQDMEQTEKTVQFKINEQEGC